MRMRLLRHVLSSILVSIQAARADCVGDTATYNESGLIVPFQNLCGQDISAFADFGDPSKEPSRAYCLMRCVQKAPICYGLDYAEDDLDPVNCWLKQLPINSSQTKLTTRVNAAVLMPDVVAGLSADCFSLGLYGCFKKNGRLGAAAATTLATSSLLSTATMTGPGSVTNTAPVATSDSTSRGISNDAKAGIGAGIGAVALLAIIAGVFWLLRGRKRDMLHVKQEHDVDFAQGPSPMEKYAAFVDSNELREMSAQSTGHVVAELESTERTGRQGGGVEAR